MATSIPDPESRLLTELHQVLSQALGDIESETRLDQDYEVAETVRFEQAQISWFDRLPEPGGELQLLIAHKALPAVSGELVHKSGDFLILATGNFHYLINSQYVTAITGLTNLSTRAGRMDSISWLENVWFHDLCDRRVIGNWFLAGSQVVTGECIRSGFDSLDISQNLGLMTVPKRQLVAASVSVTS